MAITIQGGWLDGHYVRRARKADKCNETARARRGLAPECLQDIKPGDFYAEMEPDIDSAGGFGMKKLCMCCAGPEARAAASKTEAA